MLKIDSPLVTIIITTYNHANYLSKSIQSVINQSYSNFEIIIIDDGSTDNTKQVISNFPNIIYFYQTNSGLSSARNSGINLAKGKYIIFLDADDWLFPKAIETNLKYHQNNTSLAFVSGNHFKFFINDNSIVTYKVVVESDHYLHFLKSNYVGMHATVMYNQEILKEYTFDQTLRTCEDYDMYLKISKKHLVLHHSEFIAAYRLHSSNMSANYLQMLKDALKVLNRHSVNLDTHIEKKHYRKGRKNWIEYYTNLFYWQKIRKEKKATNDELMILIKHNPKLYFRYIYHFLFNR